MGENQIEQFQIKSRRILMSFYENEEILKKKKNPERYFNLNQQ